jgi:nitric oxide dioxygenase
MLIYAAATVGASDTSTADAMRRIAHRHASLGVQREHYQTVGRHIVGAIEHALTGAYPGVTAAAAWGELYSLYATQLMAVAGQLYDKAAVDHARPLRQFVVARRIRESQDVVSLLLEPADLRALPASEPGQYVSVFVLPDGERRVSLHTVFWTRSGSRLEITVRRGSSTRGTESAGAAGGRNFPA